MLECRVTSRDKTTHRRRGGLNLPYGFLLRHKPIFILLFLSFFCLGMGSTPKDTTPPQVSITAPANNSTVFGNVNIQAQATDNVAVARVEFSVDNSLKSTDTSSPYAYSWDTTVATNTSHALKVAAYDTKNNSKQAQVNVSVNNTTPPPQAISPQITKVTPQDGATIYEGDAVAVSVSVNNGSSAVEYQFWIDAAIKQAWSKEAAFKWTAQAGRHNIKAEVKNSKGSDSKQIEIFCFRKPISPP